MPQGRLIPGDLAWLSTEAPVSSCFLSVDQATYTATLSRPRRTVTLYRLLEQLAPDEWRVVTGAKAKAVFSRIRATDIAAAVPQVLLVFKMSAVLPAVRTWGEQFVGNHCLVWDPVAERVRRTEVDEQCTVCTLVCLHR